MPLGPKAAFERFERVINAWETLRPSKSFAGMTLAQFKDALKPSFDTRSEIADLEQQLGAATSRRDDADVASQDTTLLVVNAVKGDPDEGESGVLYEAMGYIRKNERRSGLTRSAGTEPEPEPASSPTA